MKESEEEILSRSIFCFKKNSIGKDLYSWVALFRDQFPKESFTSLKLAFKLDALHKKT